MGSSFDSPPRIDNGDRLRWLASSGKLQQAFESGEVEVGNMKIKCVIFGFTTFAVVVLSNRKVFMHQLTVLKNGIYRYCGEFHYHINQKDGPGDYTSAGGWTGMKLLGVREGGRISSGVCP